MKEALLASASRSQRFIPLLLAWLLAASCSRTPPGPEPAPAPVARRNLVLVTLDTTRADRLGAYGSTEGLTPRLDALAARSTVFETAIVQAAVTPVSHASILTGFEPFHHGLRVLHGSEENRLFPERTTLAEILAAAGYRTGAFVSAFPVTRRFGLDQGFEHFDAAFLGDAESSAVGPEGAVNTGAVQRRGDATTDAALAWLAGVEEPYFLWVHYFDPHDPLVLPPEEFLAGFGDLPEEPLARWRSLYDREIAYMDAEVGRLLSQLDDDTVIAVIADHGEGLGDHGWWTHGILYQEQIRVPWILHDPGRAPGRVPELVRSIDLVPTVLELMGVGSPPVDGRSLVPLLDGEPDWETLPAYADSINRMTYAPHPGVRDVQDDVLFALIQPPWKYVHRMVHRDRRELFRLDADPAETRNLYVSEPGLVRDLQRRLREMEVVPESVTNPRETSPEDEERLRALGYLK